MRFNWRAWLAFGHDLVACAAAWLGAYWLRFTPGLPDYYLAGRQHAALDRADASGLFWASGFTAASGAMPTCPI
jgi:hypothetical protein